MVGVQEIRVSASSEEGLAQVAEDRDPRRQSPMERWSPIGSYY